MNTLYNDKLIELTDEEIIFHHYYFPFGNDKRVALNQIESVQIRQPSILSGSWRLWGGHPGIWFPKDYGRPGRNRIFIASLCNSSRRIGFTVEDSQTVADILQKLGLLYET